jgi:vanillate O-demethylase monooxygenase subunit
MFIRNAWYVAAWGDELAGGPLARRICDEPVVLFRDAAGTAAALLDMCCHRAAPLSFGRVVPAGLECGYHGMIYGADGGCVSIPGQVHIPPRARVRSFPLVEKDALLWIWMGDPADADPATIVDYPFHNDTAHWPHQHTMYEIGGSAMLMVDNLMDLTHLPYIHASTIGGSDPKAHVDAKMEVHPSDDGLTYTRWLLDHTPPPTYLKACPQLIGTKVDRWQEFAFVAPTTVLQFTGALPVGAGAYDRGEREGGFALRIFHALTPVTERSCYYFWSASNGYRLNDPQATVQLFGEIDTAFKQDKTIVEAQQARLDERGDGALINIVADGARMHMRRVVDRLAARETDAPVGV